MVAGLLASGLRGANVDSAFLGRWALTIPGGAAGWLEVRKENDWFDGALLWGGGSVLPVASLTVADGLLTVTRLVDVPRKDAAGKVVRTHQLTETITGRVEGDTLKLTHVAPRADGRGVARAEFSGRRIPALPPRPNLAKVKFGAPIALLNGRDLSGWRLVEPKAENGWSFTDGALTNRPAPAMAGQPPRRFGNLRTESEFEDFNLTVEVQVPATGNSGVYLRGIYEVQVIDSFGKPLDSHNMGALYSRHPPTVSAEKPAGEWQTLDLTLVDRHVTVILNGKNIIDNQPLFGCTGSALWSDESRPGPILLQGDHQEVSYRNLVIRPVVK